MTPTPAQATAHQTAIRVLVVDDSCVSHTIARLALRNAGYELTETDDAFEALSRLGSGNYDLVLAGLQMPILDGRGLLLEMEHVGACVPVVLIGGEPRGVAREELLSLGAAAFIDRPLNPKSLVHTIDEVCKRFVNAGESKKKAAA